MTFDAMSISRGPDNGSRTLERYILRARPKSAGDANSHRERPHPTVRQARPRPRLSAPIEVARLVPYDTQATVGYITTVAKLYYPKASADQLQRDILDPTSDIYTTGGDMQRNLMALIDPAIKITDDNGGMDCVSQPCDASPGTSSSSKQTGITAGAVVGGATVCGALGLGIFQLYRRRGSAPAWPFGKQKNRLTGSRISRPIDSVNSLGWNWLTDK